MHALIVTALAGLATTLGGMAAVVRRPGKRIMALAMGFAAGVMLTVSLADMLPAALGEYLAAFSPWGAGLAAASLLCMGMVVAGLLEGVLPEEKAFRGVGDSQKARVLRSALVTALALLLHNLPEGILTLFTGVADPQVGLRPSACTTCRRGWRWRRLFIMPQAAVQRRWGPPFCPAWPSRWGRCWRFLCWAAF